MESETYREVRIDFEPQAAQRDLPVGVRDYWFNAYDEDGQPLFRLRMRVDPVFAHFRGANPNVLAQQLGLRWIHGLIDLGWYSRGETYFETRDESWEPNFGAGSVNEEGLRYPLLDAIARGTRTEMRTSREQRVDLGGIADVMGVPDRVMEDALAGLLIEGLIEKAEAMLGESRTEGVFRITSEGARLLGALREKVGTTGPTRAIRSVVLTDIVGSTERIAETGDEEWQVELERHYKISEEVVLQFGGKVIKRTGDGILAVFDLPTQALECALGLQSRLAGTGFRIRAGVHVGEVDLTEDDITGMTVHVTARLLEDNDGLVLTTDAVRQMALGSGLVFDDQGERALRSVPGAWRLYSVALSSGTNAASVKG